MKHIISISTLLLLLVLEGCIFTPPEGYYESYEISAKRLQILEMAKSYIGTPYRYGGMGEGGFDCSGFVCYLFKHGLGKKIPRTASAQAEYFYKITKDELQKGDLLFFDTSNSGRITHVGLYLGGGKFIHASSGRRSRCVTISNLNSRFYRKAFRWGGRVIY